LSSELLNDGDFFEYPSLRRWGDGDILIKGNYPDTILEML